MKKRLLSALLCLAMAAMILAGCGSKEKSEDSAPDADTSDTKTSDANELVMGVSSSVTNLNKHLESMKEGWLMLGAVYDELYMKTESETRYYLADRVEVSDDGMTVTLTLKDNLKWHDGEAITADDIIFSLDVNADPDNGAGYANAVYIGDKPVTYEKMDDLTVQITLPEPSASYVTILGRLPLLPAHVYDNDTDIKADSEANLKGIGSGPYKVKAFKNGEYLELERFDGYYGDRPSIDKVVYKVIPDTSAQEVALQKGEINFMEISSQTAADMYEGDEEITVHTFPEGRVNYLACNKFSDTFSDPKVKEAIYAALDNEEIVEGAYGTAMGTAANTIFSNATQYYDEDIKGYVQDVDKAKKLVKETGLDDKTLKLVYNQDRAFMKETALIVQQQLKDVGIRLEVEGMESNGFFDRVFGDASDYDLYFNGYGAFGDPDEVIAGMFDGTWGINLEVSDGQLDLWKQGRAATDDAERTEIYKKLQEKAVEDMSVYPIAYPNYVFATTSSLQGADELQTNPVFEDYTKLSFK
ncbi:ABC transporter substrate-binding protein [Dorea sp. D27]|uniref:ABC transporter substrate-binding protein n=1 Tax=Dorea sp. D27 TaxID=658665 RepID=UPI0006733331|nr:ABC transporter substrate-binding protein [Dorea sp. D27]KMZ54226.1 putative oligopeptide ABC transporter, oligopeptide-binding protein [Dorea sp. D27]